MFNISDGANLSIEFNLMELHKRFEEGELGIAFPKFMEDTKTVEIFEKDFVNYLQERTKKITDDYILNFIDLLMDKRALWINYQVNIMVSLFKSAVAMWINGAENLDRIIISLMTPDFLYELVDVMKEMYDDILDGNNGLVAIQQDIVPLMDAMGGSDFAMNEIMENDDFSKYFENIPGLKDNSTDKKLH